MEGPADLDRHQRVKPACGIWGMLIDRYRDLGRIHHQHIVPDAAAHQVS